MARISSAPWFGAAKSLVTVRKTACSEGQRRTGKDQREAAATHDQGTRGIRQLELGDMIPGLCDCLCHADIVRRNS